MKIKCDYCGNTYEEFQTSCPSCGAPNPSHADNKIMRKDLFFDDSNADKSDPNYWKNFR